MKRMAKLRQRYKEVEDRALVTWVETASLAAADAQAQSTQDPATVVTREMIARLQEDAARAFATYNDEADFGSMWSLERIFDADPIM
jgi:hypothetical protein